MDKVKSPTISITSSREEQAGTSSPKEASSPSVTVSSSSSSSSSFSSSSSSSSPSGILARRRVSVVGGSSDLMRFDLSSPVPSPRRTPTALGDCEGSDKVAKAIAVQFGSDSLSPSLTPISIGLMHHPKAMRTEAATFCLEIKNLLQSGDYYLEPIHGKGINESYFLIDSKTDKKIAIFKSQLAELECIRRSRIGIRQGELCLAEAAVMEIAQNAEGQKLISLPPTILLMIQGKLIEKEETGRCKFEKGNEACVGSFQKFIENGRAIAPLDLEKVPILYIQRLALFDLLSLNTDRNHNNYLGMVSGELIPIDHGCCFPKGFCDPCNFAWLEHSAVGDPIEEELKKYVSTLQPKQIIENLRGYFSQSRLSTIAEFQKVSYEADRDPLFIEKRLQSLYFTLHLVKQGIERGMTLRQLGVLLIFNGKFAAREFSAEFAEIFTILHGASSLEANLTSGRILEKQWEKIERAIEQYKLLDPIIEEVLTTFFSLYDTAWKQVIQSPNQFLNLVKEESHHSKLKEFIKTPQGKSFFALYQQEKLFELLS